MATAVLRPSRAASASVDGSDRLSSPPPSPPPPSPPQGWPPQAQAARDATRPTDASRRHTPPQEAPLHETWQSLEQRTRGSAPPAGLAALVVPPPPLSVPSRLSSMPRCVAPPVGLEGAGGGRSSEAADSDSLARESAAAGRDVGLQIAQIFEEQARQTRGDAPC